MTVRFVTQELDEAQKVLLMGYYQKFGWLLFSEQEHDDSLELAEIRRDTGGKTPSQRLRAVIYVEYQQSGRTDLTFEQYYSQKMEKFIGYVKQNLQD